MLIALKSNVKEYRFLAWLVAWLLCVSSFNTLAQTQYNEQWLEQQLTTADEKSIKDPSLAVSFLELLLAQHSLKPIHSAKLKLELLSNYLLIGMIRESEPLFVDVEAALADLPIETKIKYLMAKSSYYNFTGNNDDAESLLKQAVSESLVIEDNELLSDVYGNLGSFYVYTHDDIKAIEAYSKAYELVRKTGNELKVAYIETGMAKSYESLYDYERAIELQKNSLKYFDEHQLHFDRLVTHYHLTRIYLKMDMVAEALGHTLAMQDINEQVANSTLKYYTYILSAEVHRRLNEIDKARDYLNLSQVINSQLEDINSRTNYLYTKAGIEIAEKDFSAATQTLEKAQSIVADLPDEQNINIKLTLYELLSELAAGQKQFQQAYQYQQRFIKLNDLYHDSVREVARSRHKVMFDIKQMELHNQLLEKDKELNDFALFEVKQQQKVQSIIFISILVLFAAVLIFTWRQYRLKRKFSYLANTDPLTGVANRRKVISIAEQKWQALDEEALNFSLITFDLDHFKQVNDKYGHPAGDVVLQKVTETAGLAIREHDVLGRIGGEEFLVVLENTQLEQAKEIALRIKQDIENLDIQSDEGLIKVTASFGVVQKTNLQSSFKDLIKKSDKALYTAKERGRNRVETDD